MNFTYEQYAMSFHQAREHGIDYRNFEKIECLPVGVRLTAIAGIWGDYQNIRCLFMGECGQSYLRNIRGGGGEYVIRELGQNAKEIAVGQVFVVKGEDGLPYGDITKPVV